MRLSLLLGILLIFSMMIAGCNIPTSVCGDGTCSSQEEVLENCPDDCEPTAPCSDTDGGLNYYVRGSIKGAMPQDFNPADICLSPTRLREVYCDNEFGAAYQYECPAGCTDGACVKQNATAPACGDGKIQSGEECDGATVSKSCVQLGYAGGVISCNSNCKFDKTKCLTCNNNKACESSLGETTANCAGDCTTTPVCNNNGVCNTGETIANCPNDCIVSIVKTISIDPATATVTNGNTVALDIKVSNVVDFYGFQFNVGYNSQILQFVSATKGTFLGNNGQVDLFCLTPNSTVPGLIKNVVCTRLGDIPGVSGTGMVERITFKAIAKGVADVVLSNVKLLDSNANGITATSIGNGKVTVN